jgi:transposase-like protein
MKSQLKFSLLLVNFNPSILGEIMPRGYPALNETQKKEIIRRVTDNGEKVSELSKEYGVVSKTIYKLLGQKANVLELSKLRRENEALLSIIGSLVAESNLGKKKR